MDRRTEKSKKKPVCFCSSLSKYVDNDFSVAPCFSFSLTNTFSATGIALTGRRVTVLAS